MKSAKRFIRKMRARVFVDVGAPEATVLLAGMARSGTTWAAQLLNYDGARRVLFEPFNPRRVPAAAPFEYIQYMNPDRRDGARAAAALKILAGNVRGRWADVDNRRFVFTERIIKDVRVNLMLRWLRAISPRVPIILLVRHPLAVAASWLQLGWGGPPAPDEHRYSDYEVITAQRDLLHAIPVVEHVARRIDVADPVQRIVFQWCVFHLVPFSQFSAGEIDVVFYENLMLRPEQQAERLFRRLGRRYEWSRLSAAVQRPSTMTDKRAFEPGLMLTGWKDVLTANQIRMAISILTMFGLDEMYSCGPGDLEREPALPAFHTRTFEPTSLVPAAGDP